MHVKVILRKRLKKELVGVVFEIEKNVTNDNETGWKEGEGIEMSNYSAFHIRECTALFRF